jgi:hypothetical protein
LGGQRVELLREFPIGVVLGFLNRRPDRLAPTFERRVAA